MEVQIKLKDVIEGLEFLTDEGTSYLNRVWLFFDDVHLMISKCGARLGRCVWSA
jgi:hypothetical protein